MMKKTLCGVALILAALGEIQAQTKSDPNPRIGLQAAGVYAISDIETISRTNGNMTLNIPLGSLGPDAAGTSHGIGLIYNSKIWEPAILNNGPYVRGFRPAPGSAGWRYQAGYDLEQTFREGVVDCGNPPDQNPSLEAFYYFKVRVVFPDGSRHLMRLKDDPDLGGDGYHRYGLDGRTSGNCGSNLAQAAGPLVYYTTDGTFVRLVVLHDSSTPKPKLSWTLYFANGDYVLGGNAPGSTPFQGRPQQICDRNANCVSLQSQFNDSTATFGDAYFTSITDQYNRSIQVTYGGMDLHNGPDTITVPGYNGETLTWSVAWTSVSSSAQYNCPEVSNGQASTCTAGTVGYAVSDITPPSQLGLGHYLFTYGARWGELSTAVLPSGLMAKYSYWRDPSGYTNWYDVLANYPSTKKVFWDGVDTSDPDEVSSLDIHQTVATMTSYDYSVFTGPDGSVSTTKFNAYSYDGGTTLGDWSGGLVYEIDQPDGTIIAKTWAQNPLPGSKAARTDCPSCGQWFPYDSHNPYVQSEMRTVGSLVSTTTFTVDLNGNPLTTTTHPAWDSGAARTTTLTYLNGTLQATSTNSTTGAINDPNVFWNSGAAALLSFPLTRLVTDSSSSAGEQFCYDSHGNVLIHAGSKSGSVSGLVNCSTDGSGSGANLTAATNAVVTQYRYGTAGNPLIQKDPRGVSTQFTYDSNNLYVIKKEEACHQTLTIGTCSPPEARTTQYTNDFNTGKVKSVIDTGNSSVTTVTNYDVFGRPTSITDPTSAVTSINYQDASGYIMTTPPSSIGVSAVCFDKLGRTTVKQTSENGFLTPCSPVSSTAVTGVETSYQYVASGANAGSYQWISNPKRTSGQSVDGWIRKHSDSTGRIVEEATFSGSIKPAYDAATSSVAKVTFSYSGPCATFKDQAENASAGTGVVRTTCVDAAGRISTVTETVTGTSAPAGCTGGGTYICTTTYTYDVLDNLRTVAQGSQTRTFNYDPLGRLTSATNPESGTVSYVYDNNGNLIEKQDPRPRRDSSGNPLSSTHISMCYGSVSGTACTTDILYSATIGYDGLNRPRFKGYTDGLPPSYTDRTPAVSYVYDADMSGGLPNYPKGRLVTVSSGGTTVQYKQFDAAGRVLKHSQSTATQTPEFSYAYNAAGQLTQMTYPSGRIVTTSYDGAGRAKGLQGVRNAATTNYAGTPTGQDISYWAHGGMYQMKLGNGLTEQWTYNFRLQPTDIRLGTSPGSASVRGLVLDYGSTANNENLLTQTISGTGLSASVGQSYGYDRVNRIQSAAEGATWSRTFDYDRYGNGWVSGANLSAFTPISPFAYNSLNQLTIGGMAYDEAGNQKQAGFWSFGYDAENRLIWSRLSDTTVYQYDGNGRRVAKVSCPSGANTCDTSTAGAVVTTFAYDAFGNEAAEYASSGAAAPCTTCYLMTDHLGSTRVVTNASGTAVECHDYEPFGEEILTGRSSCYPTTQGNGHLFTGKERDKEVQNSAMPSGLDYFEARYFSGAQGRFTSPDPFNIIMRAENREHFETYLSQPQNWNAYVYTWNNPLRYTDPTGETVYVIAYTTGNESGDEEFKRVAQTRANEIRNAKGFDPKKDTVLVRGIKSFDDLKGLVKDANALDKTFGKVGELSIVSHAGQDGPNFNYGHNRAGGPRYSNEQNPSGIASLTVNWDSSARACFLGCRTADRYSNGGFAQSFADRQGVPAYGFPDTSGFSSSPSGRSYWYVLGLGGQNLYMTNRDGRPPVRKDPTKPK